MLVLGALILSSCMLRADISQTLYLDLMKNILTNTIYQDSATTWDHVHGIGYQDDLRQKGLDWPNVAHTMIGLARLDNLQFCIEDVLRNNIEGDFIETGVWRGGATIFMRAMLKLYGDTTRKVFVADSFEGLPVSNPKLYPADAPYDFTQYEVLSVSLSQVQENFRRYGLLDDQVVFLKGWFKDTLPVAPMNKLAILRLDGDLYESTMDALVNLYSKLSIGGYVIVDDYSIRCCAQAILDFRLSMGINDPILYTNDGIAVYWKRTK